MIAEARRIMERARETEGGHTNEASKWRALDVALGASDGAEHACDSEVGGDERCDALRWSELAAAQKANAQSKSDEHIDMHDSESSVYDSWDDEMEPPGVRGQGEAPGIIGPPPVITLGVFIN